MGKKSDSGVVVMQLPEGWITKSIAECFKLKSGDNLTTKMMDSTGSYPVFGGNGIAGYHTEYNLDGNNVIIGRVGALCGNVRYTNEKIWLTDNCFKVIDRKYSFDDTFLTYLLTSKELGKYARQAAQPVVSNSSLKDVLISFPVSRKEQKRIVAILDEAFAGISQAIANTEKNLANARELFESYLNSIFEQGQAIWKNYKIEEVCESIIDCVNKTAPQVDETTSYKMIRTSNVKKGKVNLDNVKYVSKEIYETWTRRQVPQHGDIILTREAPMGEVGMLLLEDDENVFLGQRLVSYRVNTEKLNNFFLLYAFQSTVMQKQIASFASGSTVQHMRIPDTKILKIAIPTIDEQLNIVKKLTVIKTYTNSLENNAKQKLQSLAELKQSLLQKAFTGELTANNIDKMVDV